MNTFICQTRKFLWCFYVLFSDAFLHLWHFFSSLSLWISLKVELLQTLSHHQFLPHVNYVILLECTPPVASWQRGCAESRCYEGGIICWMIRQSKACCDNRVEVCDRNITPTTTSLKVTTGGKMQKEEEEEEKEEEDFDDDDDDPFLTWFLESDW